MQGISYSVCPIMAIFIHIIINHDILRKNQSELTKTGKAYRNLVLIMLAFFVLDSFWGVTDIFKNHYALYINTFALYIVMSFAVILWSKYVIAYLNFDDIFGKGLNVACMTFGASVIIITIINVFYPILFWVGENNSYNVGVVRHIIYIVQISIFACTGLQTAYVARKTEGQQSRRYAAVANYGAVMVASSILQIKWPFLPIYTIAFLIGSCVFHVFIIEDEKEEFSLRTEEHLKLAEKENAIINSLAEIYNSIYYIDMSDHSFIELGTIFPQVREIIGEGGSADDAFEEMYKHLVYTEYHAEVKEFCNLNTLNERLKDRVSITVNFEGPDYGWSQGVFIAGERDENGNCQHVFWATKDYNTEKEKEVRAQREIEKARDAAQKASEAKSEFLFSMSHDIRTPMNAIMGFTELLEKYSDDAEKREDYIEKIRTANGLLLSLVNDVLEMSRIESGKVKLEEVPVDASIVAKELIEVFGEQMMAKNIGLIENNNITHPYIYADTVKVREIMLNILSNAYKYTPHGGTVVISFDEFPAEEGYSYFRTTIEDNGIGMDKEFIPHIFEEFAREHTSTEVKVEGTGLGMPIVKRLVDMMGGTIEVESEKGIGTKVTVTIKHRQADPSDIEGYSEPEDVNFNFEGRRILLAEDNLLNAEIAIELLEEVGFEIDHATDGLVCLKKLERAEDGYYDLVLMDIQMPRMDGYEATRKIRQLEDEVKASIPIIAMTANAFEEDKKNALEAGMNDHIAKPVEVPKLMKALKRFIN